MLEAVLFDWGDTLMPWEFDLGLLDVGIAPVSRRSDAGRGRS